MARRIFSREFKVEAVRLVKKRGISVAQACRDLDVHENLSRQELTAHPAQAFPGRGQQTPGQLEIERLRREVAKLRAERDTLKKGRSLLRERSEMRCTFIAKHRSVWPVAWLCEALDVPRWAFTPGCVAGRASGRSPTGGENTRELWAAPAPMAPAVSVGTSWRKASPAACTRSNG